MTDDDGRERHQVGAARVYDQPSDMLSHLFRLGERHDVIYHETV